jgi:hypothetical protein
MSSDLTFITNEQGRSLADRFSVLLGKNTRAFDCLVGYFYLSGFRRLSEALKPTEKIRILIGLSTDQPTFDLLKQAKDQMQMALRSLLSFSVRLGPYLSHPLRYLGRMKLNRLACLIRDEAETKAIFGGAQFVNNLASHLPFNDSFFQQGIA